MSTSKVDQILQEARRLGKAERYEEEEALVRSALEVFPDDVELCLRAGISLQDPKEAMASLERAASLSPDDPVTLIRCASSAYDRSAFDRSRDWTEEAFEQAPRDFQFGAHLIHMIGKLAAREEELQTAEQALRAAFEMDPAFTGHARVLALFLREEGRSREAAEVVEEGLVHLPADPSLVRLREELKDAS